MNKNIWKHGLGRAGNEEYDKKIRNKLKGSSSEKRKHAQRLRRLREMTPEQLEEKGIDLLKSSERLDLEILYLIQELLKKDLPDKTKLDLLGKMVSTRTAFFGQKNYNANLNINTTAEEVVQRLRAWKSQGINVGKLQTDVELDDVISSWRDKTKQRLKEKKEEEDEIYL